ncbi:unnamed protein product [Acanthoscelides obtectus]|uniref:Uncharacterized protein n=1 Tax=Acanthoscelides obtectus TaxID=200917 RepID=A0A9P0KIG7_ACAOB|nr:unnamed protein product [Acanthoscelides obtectus]CAK1661620.1 hypothetical protein AOBTE_LOCUS22722 [Acanthoscelides obtectus]
MTGFVGATGRMPFSAFLAYFSAVCVTDLVHLCEKIKKHENSKTHLHNSMELALLGTVNIRAQLDSAYWRNIQQHNDTVIKNSGLQEETLQTQKTNTGRRPPLCQRVPEWGCAFLQTEDRKCSAYSDYGVSKGTICQGGLISVLMGILNWELYNWCKETTQFWYTVRYTSSIESSIESSIIESSCIRSTHPIVPYTTKKCLAEKFNVLRKSYHQFFFLRVALLHVVCKLKYGITPLSQTSVHTPDILSFKLDEPFIRVKGRLL